MAKSRRIAIMIDPDWPLKRHQEVIIGINRYADERDNWDYAIDMYAAESLHSGRSAYDGVVARATARLAQRARQAKVPVVNVWYNSPAGNLPTVLPDYERAVRITAEYLLARGFRHFAYFAYRDDRTSLVEDQVFRSIISAAGFSYSTYLAFQGYDKRYITWKPFLIGLQKWIDSWTYPIGVLVSDDVFGLYMTQICRQKGIRIPEDAAIVSAHNENAYCMHSRTSLTSIDYNFPEVGYRAAALLDHLMEGATPPTAPILITPELVVRQSTEVAAVGDSLVSRALWFIADHNDRQYQVSDVAAHVQASRRTLERRFRVMTGRTIAEEIARQRIERVKRQLVESETPIKTLAVDLGFGTTKQLCKTFRRVEGISPGEYREKHRV